MSLIKILSSNPSSIKSRFSRRFLRALMKIKNESSSTTTTTTTTPSRVKLAADKSMALAVGSRRAWSRATLWKIRHQQHKLGRRLLRRRRGRRVVSLRRINIQHRRSLLLREKKKKKKKKRGDDGLISPDNELRKLVPGGKAMDLASLLDETAHYLKCLVAQVQVMRSIDQFYDQFN